MKPIVKICIPSKSYSSHLECVLPSKHSFKLRSSQIEKWQCWSQFGQTLIIMSRTISYSITRCHALTCRLSNTTSNFSPMSENVSRSYPCLCSLILIGCGSHLESVKLQKLLSYKFVFNDDMKDSFLKVPLKSVQWFMRYFANRHTHRDTGKNIIIHLFFLAACDNLRLLPAFSMCYPYLSQRQSTNNLSQCCLKTIYSNLQFPMNWLLNQSIS